MDRCIFITLFIKMLKHNIATPFPSRKLSWFQNDRDLVDSTSESQTFFRSL